MGHNSAPESKSTLSDRSGNRPQQWVTGVGHNRSARGLSRRGSLYQFRVRVPADLRAVLGSTHVKRSLRTDSRSLAIRLSRKVAAEIDAMFEAKRLEIGLAVEGRLLPSASPPATVEKTIERRSEKASAQTMGLTLSQVYDRYLADPTKRRSARTMLAHQTTRRVVEDGRVRGSATSSCLTVYSCLPKLHSAQLTTMFSSLDSPPWLCGVT